MRANTPGRKFSTNTSLRAISFASTARPSSCRRFRVSDRLLRLNAAKYQLMPPRIAPWLRTGSPAPGLSILTTSAPISASSIVQNGPAKMRVRSTTRIPVSGINNSPCSLLAASLYWDPRQS
jgi:hypothetical protein